MDKKTKIFNLHAKGIDPEDIAKELDSGLEYVSKVIDYERRRLEMDGKDKAEAIHETRMKIVRKEKLMRNLIPYKNEQDKESFHELEKEIQVLNSQLTYLKSI